MPVSTSNGTESEAAVCLTPCTSYATASAAAASPPGVSATNTQAMGRTSSSATWRAPQLRANDQDW